MRASRAAHPLDSLHAARAGHVPQTDHRRFVVPEPAHSNRQQGRDGAETERHSRRVLTRSLVCDMTVEVQ